MFYKGDFIYLYTVDFASELNGFVFFLALIIVWRD